MADFFVRQKGIEIYSPSSMISRVIAAIMIWSVLPFMVVIDVVATVYQGVYFSIMRIPKIPRSTFVQFNRHALGKLNWKQKASCWYCEYANGLIAWLKALANQTEIYSCAIKYSHKFPGQEYQKEFYEPEEFK